MEDHRHDETGRIVFSEPDPSGDELEAAEAVTEASVRIAEIEANKEITLAKIAARAYQPDIEAELEAAREEIRVLRAQLEPPAPEAAEPPAPVVIMDDSAPGDEQEAEESLPEPDEHNSEPERKSRAKLGLGVW